VPQEAREEEIEVEKEEAQRRPRRQTLMFFVYLRGREGHPGAARTTEDAAQHGCVATAMRRVAKSAILGCAAVATGLLLTATAASAAAPSHEFLFALEGGLKEPGHVVVPPPEGEFEDPCGVAVDSVGDLYVSDYYHHTIDVYGPFREYLTQIRDTDPDGPCNLAVDATGDVYVNNWRRDVVRFAPSEFPPTEATRYGPEAVIDHPTATGARSTGVALDPATGTLYVDDRTEIAVYEAAALAEAEPQPTRTLGLGLLGQGYGIAVSDFPATAGEIYVPDAATDTVLVLSPTGSLITELGGAGTPQRGFVSLLDSAVAIDPNDGHLLVADDTEPGLETPAGVVDEFNAAGDYRDQLPHAIVDAGPSALAVDAAGNVYATSGNSEGGAVLGFGPTGPAHLLSVAVAGAGSGSVTSEPTGIDCAGACAAEFAAGEEVLLTAIPASGSAFAGWSGCDRSTAARCDVSLGADRQVSAEFEPAPVPAASAASPEGGPAPQPAAAQPPAEPAAIVLRQLGGGGGSALLSVAVPGTGTLSIHGALVRGLHRKLAVGSHRLRLVLNPAGARSLRDRGRLVARLAVSFQPPQGTTVTSEARVDYRAQPRRGGP
jgi:DNA-binding beta-propeller fold protein YncE